MGTIEVLFLDVDEVVAIHARSIDKYGGSHGIRDYGLVESAVLAPQQTFGGEQLYPTIGAMAAAYWHGLVMNHAFVDGNKRIGLRVAVIFLAVNGYCLTQSSSEVEDVTMRLAQGEVSREELTALVERSLVPLPNSAPKLMK